MDKRKIILGILAVIVVTIITMIVVIINLNKKQELLELQEVATIKYFEECMDIKELYLKSENTYTDVNEPQFLEIQLKLALDNYFKENAGAESAPANEIKVKMWNPHEYIIDFNGIYVSGYTYQAENDSFIKATDESENQTDTNSLMQLVEDKLKGIDNQEIKVDRIEKLKKGTYMVYANLIGYKNALVNNEDDMLDINPEKLHNPENPMDLMNQSAKDVVANAFITVEVKDGKLTIASVETKDVK